MKSHPYLLSEYFILSVLEFWIKLFSRYEQNMEEFRKKVEETVRSSKNVLYNPIESNDAHMIR